MAITEEPEKVNPAPSPYLVRKTSVMRELGDWYDVWEVYRRTDKYPLCECATLHAAMQIEQALRQLDRLSVSTESETA